MDGLPKEHIKSIFDFAQRPLFFAKCTALPFGGLVFNSTFWAGDNKVFRSDAGCGANAFRQRACAGQAVESNRPGIQSDCESDGEGMLFRKVVIPKVDV